METVVNQHGLELKLSSYHVFPRLVNWDTIHSSFSVVKTQSGNNLSNGSSSKAQGEEPKGDGDSVRSGEEGGSESRDKSKRKWFNLNRKGSNRGCEDSERQSGVEEKETVRKKKDLRSLMEEEKKTNNVVVMSYDTNYYRLSADIAKETWIVGGIQDPLFRSRSWKK
ncbi:unnamed protein product [Microthlaspi erraticum]|uniref:Uncharacterized protein n=1 Tax=Microthlaspi erraticum TaxID=1685480 RepID=A0A6D2K5P3_9BRAS|nr:unnamed protein product [Microthlaspi erraticum]CAA7047234.1 unnamed protein product [Microthlaspi erraticum]